MKITKTIIVFIFLLLAGALKAQVSESEYKAAFIERFTRFVEWPKNFENNTFKIVIIGKTQLKNSLNELFENTKIKDLNVDLIYTKDINDLKNANLVFICDSENKRLDEILEVIHDLPILTISDTDGFGTTGIHINMYNDNSYIRYEINPESIKKSKLNISSLLLSSAKIVETDE